MTIPESVRALIATGPNAHLTTLNADGSPEVTVVWVGIDNDELVIGHMGVWHKVKNVRRDPRVALSMLTRDKNAIGTTVHRRGSVEFCSTVAGKDAADRQARESFVGVAAPIGVAGHMT
jgi:PPOX class probable F420-dependent enzyme